MRADPFQIGDVLKDPKRFVVPIYQRTYAWKIKPHLETFFAQVESKAEERLGTNRPRWALENRSPVGTLK